MVETIIYWVRHGESMYAEQQERTRGLSLKGEADALTAAKLLEAENIDAIVSSPYERAIQTVKPLADRLEMPIDTYEDLKERTLAGPGVIANETAFHEAIQKVYAEPEFSFPGGESNRQAQQRGMAALRQVLDKYAGKRVAIGTHGNIMTLLLNFFDPDYGWEFWKQTSMPDIYRMTLRGMELASVERLWHEAAAEPELILTKEWRQEDADYILQQLLAYNMEHAAGSGSSHAESMPVNVLVKDREGRVKGGILGRAFLGVLHIGILWLEPSIRKLGYGRKLLAEIERIARDRECVMIHLDTFSFQAPDFYRNLGYEVFGVLEGYPDGTKRYFLKKTMHPDTPKAAD